MMLCEEVCKVILTSNPECMELRLLDTITEPIEAHIDCLGLLLLHSVVHNTICGIASSAAPCI